MCYEASCGYGPLHDALRRLAHQIQVAHPGHLRLIFRSKKVNDRVDAQKLAKLLAYRTQNLDFDTAIEWSGTAIGMLAPTADVAEGVKSFVEERDPRFLGR